VAHKSATDFKDSGLLRGGNTPINYRLRFLEKITVTVDGNFLSQLPTRLEKRAFGDAWGTSRNALASWRVFQQVGHELDGQCARPIPFCSND
jgi:hypothetical protein